MSIPVTRAPMTADEFIAWAMRRQDGMPRHELVAGEVVAMAPERAVHARVKFAVVAAIQGAIKGAGLPCEAFIDGMAVEIDARTVYEPDALVRCGEPIPDDAVKITDPVILVEVLSPSTRARDAGAKLADYLRIATVRHYLIVDAGNRTVIHHARSAEDGQIRTAILREGTLDLDPPGLRVTVESFFP